MTYYAANCLFESIHQEEPGQQFKEIIFLIEANTLASATNKAIEMAKGEAIEVDHDEGNTITWRFNHVLNIYNIAENQLNEGTKLYSRMIQANEFDTVESIIARFYPEIIQNKTSKMHYPVVEFWEDVEMNREIEIVFNGKHYSFTNVEDRKVFTDTSANHCVYFSDFSELLNAVEIEGFQVAELVKQQLLEDVRIF